MCACCCFEYISSKINRTLCFPLATHSVRASQLNHYQGSFPTLVLWPFSQARAVDTTAKFRYSCLDFVLTFFGLILLLSDVGLEIWASLYLYQETAYVSLTLLGVFLMGSPVITQTSRWLWYKSEEGRKSQAAAWPAVWNLQQVV